DLVASQRRLRGQRERPLRAAPLAERDGALVALVALAVLQAEVPFRPRREEDDAASGVAAEDGLEVDLFPELVDAAVAEHRSAEQRLGLPEVEGAPEGPGLDALVPVAPHVGHVAVLLGRDQEAELPRALRIAQRKSGGEGGPVASRRPRPPHVVVEAANGDPSALHRGGVGEPRDEDQRVLGAVLYAEAESGYLADLA